MSYNVPRTTRATLPMTPISTWHPRVTVSFRTLSPVRPTLPRATSWDLLLRSRALSGGTASGPKDLDPLRFLTDARDSQSPG